VFDRKAMHFDRSRPYMLEETYDFAVDMALMEKAVELSRRMREEGMAKYRLSVRRSVAEVIDPTRKKILLLGQVEADLSIRYGAERLITGNELLQLAADENPDAQILYRPHPEALAYAKAHYSKPAGVAHIATILTSDFGVGDCLNNANKAYTVTSLPASKRLCGTSQVVTLGAPFYSGWEFTEDRLPNTRRNRRLTPLEVLAGAYLLYPNTAPYSITNCLRRCVERIDLKKAQRIA
jgi:capsular polysaccharide export protein